jgi:hypothetical protein
MSQFMAKPARHAPVQNTDWGSRVVAEVGTTFIATIVAVAYHSLYTVATSPGLADKLSSLTAIEQFQLVKQTTDVHFDLLLAGFMLALGKKVTGIKLVLGFSVFFVLLGPVGGWLEIGLKHNPQHPFNDGAALAAYWIPNTCALIMFLVTTLVVSQKEAQP